MPTSSAVATGSRLFFIQLGLLVVGVFSVLILFSFGGQLVVAPALLPAQWMIARDTDGMVSVVFSALGGLLLAEVAGLGMGLLGAWLNLPSLLVTLMVLVGVLTGILFFRSSRSAES